MPSLSPTTDAQELRSLDYFRTRTVPELAGSFNSELWSRFILQTAQHEPAVRHAIIALGSLHEHFESAEDAHAADSDFGLHQYGKAIQCVVRQPAPFAGQSTDLALISCILFTAFESLQGHYRSALTHIVSGLKVLAEREASGEVHGSYIPKELLKSLFTRFDTQALEIGDLAFRPGIKTEPDLDLDIPQAFSSLEEAEHFFAQYFNTLLHFLQAAESTDRQGVPVPDHARQALGAQHAKHVLEYQAWCNAFDNYLALHLTIDRSPTSLLQAQPHPGILILQIWRIVVHIILNIDLSAGELCFDSFIVESRNLVELAESFVKQTATPSRSANVPDKVSLTKVEPQSPPSGAAMPPTEYSSPSSCWSGSCASHGILGIQPNAVQDVPLGTAPSPPISNILGTADSYPSPTCTDSSATSTKEPKSYKTPIALAPKPPTALKPTFSLSLGLITPLYITVSRCRDPSVRRRALHLLFTCNRKEGIWDSRLAARVGQRIVEVEEAGAVPLPGYGSSNGTDTVVVISADQIPEHARVRELETSFLPDRMGRIRYTKSAGGGYSNPDPSEYYEELLQW